MLDDEMIIILTFMISLCGIINPDTKCPVFRHFSNFFSSLGDLEFLREAAYAVSKNSQRQLVILLMLFIRPFIQ